MVERFNGIEEVTSSILVCSTIFQELDLALFSYSMIITGKKFSKPEMSRVKNGDIILNDNDNQIKRRRLDHILVEKYPTFNRSTLQNFIKSGYVKLNDAIIKKPNFEVIVEDKNGPIENKIEMSIPERDKKLDIENITIYEDENVLVINKPAGLLSMAKGEFTTETTLEDYGLLVHRLDRDTSGVVILAKNEATQSMLRRQFQERKTHKTYVAIVQGEPKNPEAIINLPIARNLKHPTTFMVDPKGKPSETYYKVLETKNGKSMVELKPVTGRTHQLRVHLKYIGCPIIGDPIYNPDSKGTRLFLHARSLEITIPNTSKKDTSGERRMFEAKIPMSFNKELQNNVF